MSSEPIDYQDSSGNVFADLGLGNADELYARAQIGIEVLRILQERQLKQNEIAEVLGIGQLDVSHLLNGHFSYFSEGKLLNFLKKLDRQVTLLISQPDQTEPVVLPI